MGPARQVWLASWANHPGGVARLSKLRGCLHHGPWSCPMPEGIVPWSHNTITLAWSDFSKYAFFNPLGPWLGVNWTWTKRSDHAPKNGCLDSSSICPKRGVLINFFMFDRSPSSSFLSSYLWKHLGKKITAFLYYGPLTFPTREPLLPLPLQNPLDHDSG